MIILDREFKSVEDAKTYLEHLIDLNQILSYEIQPTYDEYYFKVYITPRVERIEISSMVVGGSYKNFTLE